MKRQAAPNHRKRKTKIYTYIHTWCWEMGRMGSYCLGGRGFQFGR
jgi:hypothetical protein